MKVLRNIGENEVLEQCARPTISTEQINPLIEEVYKEVAEKGDRALKKYTHFFDKIEVEAFEVERESVQKACDRLSPDLKLAIERAAENIAIFHRAQLQPVSKVETSPGVVCWQEARGIENVGIYIPGGSAPLFSTVLMLAIPAKIANCKKVVLCSPPNAEGVLDDAILFAAALAQVDEIYTIGGAQAIAAMTFGTESIPKVDKIFGPGNQFVTAAKVKSQQFGVAIDMPAGPSELMVVADNGANPSFVVSDLLSQAEHGADSQVICVLLGESLVADIQVELEKQLNQLPRSEIATQSLENSKMIIVDSLEGAVELINGYGPEHLILMTQNNDVIIPQVNNAGSVFLGEYTPESAGDYASGTNHTLPTGGATKAHSGVNMDAFCKKITFQEISKNGLLDLGPTIELMAQAENLQGHKNAITIRLKEIQNEN